ncbi:MAG TPA: hypothetical protein VFX59_00360 [Polyangiales bacterium]|nr:hypothetical protein [Polyangiales bacterium]
MGGVFGAAVGCGDGSDPHKSGIDPETGVDHDIEQLSLDEGEFSVGVGEEVSYCVRIPMPKKFKGRQLALVGWESDVPKPTHHYFMTYSSEGIEGDKPVPCQGDSGILPQSESTEGFFSSGVLNTKLLFATAVGQQKLLTDIGYGMVIEADGTFVTNHHVLNVLDQPADMYARFKLQVKDASLVPHPVRSLVCSTVSLDIPAASTTTATFTCTVPWDADIMLLAGHAHARLTTFSAQFFDGKTTQPELIYQTKSWDSPDMKVLDQPLHLTKGQGITFTCEYENRTDKTINFGLSANDEMCTLFGGYAYPVDRTFEIPPPLAATGLRGKFPAIDSTNLPSFF